MKQLFLIPGKAILLCMSFLAISMTLNAQADPGTDDDGFTVHVESSGGLVLDLVNTFQDCGWVGSTYGPSLTDDLCGDLAWGYTAAGDSLGCAPIVTDLTGKIALIRRGVCNFSLKVYNAQQAGAVGVIISNHYSNPDDGPCVTRSGTLFFGGMSGGDSATAVVIPSVFIQRMTCEQLDDELKAGNNVNICFSFPRLFNQTAVYHYATPLSQVDSIGEGIMSVFFNNRGNTTLNNVVIKADVVAPSGNVTSYERIIATSLAGQEDTIDFPTYKPDLELGKFKVVFSNSAYTTSRDSLTTFFEHTDYTFATDNLVIDPLGIGPTDADFISGNFFIQNGGLCITGTDGGAATYATFGIANADTVFVDGAGDEANTIGIIVYDADADNNGVIDMTGGWADLQFNQVGIGSYTMTGDEGVDALIDVPIYDFSTGSDPVPLVPQHPYYISLVYDGTLAGTGYCIRFSNTTDVPYRINLTTPLEVTGDFFSGWNGAEVIQRMQLEGYVPTSTKESKLLDASKVNITPNPANDIVRLDVALEKVSNAVAVSLLDWTGRPVRTQVEKNFQNGQITMQVGDLPSGYYLAWIRTSEGSTMKKVAICH